MFSIRAYDFSVVPLTRSNVLTLVVVETMSELTATAIKGKAQVRKVQSRNTLC